MLEILRPGVQTSVQDRGRRGLRHLGIAQAGALDMPALYRANSLLGNDPDAAGLEITLGPVSVRFGRDAWLALSGAHFHPELNGRPIHTGQRVFAQAGHTLTLSFSPESWPGKPGCGALTRAWRAHGMALRAGPPREGASGCGLREC